MPEDSISVYLVAAGQYHDIDKSLGLSHFIHMQSDTYRRTTSGIARICA